MVLKNLKIVSQQRKKTKITKTTKMSNKANLYDIKLPEKIVNECKIFSIKNEKIVLRYINNNFSESRVSYKRGDIIHPEQLSRYRNDFKYIYNGTKFEKLGTLNDEYGEVPKTFLTFTEFPPFYWEDTIDHNQNHYINPSLLKMEKITTLYEGLNVYIYIVKYKSKSYKIGSTTNIENKKAVVIEPVFENKYFDFVVKQKKYSKLQSLLEF